MVTLILFYVKSLNAKTGVTSHLSVPEYGITNASNFKCGITSGATQKWGNTIDIYLYKSTDGKSNAISQFSVPRVWDA